MVEERNMLMEDLYPKLKYFCRDKYGLEFQVSNVIVNIVTIKYGLEWQMKK